MILFSEDSEVDGTHSAHKWPEKLLRSKSMKNCSSESSDVPVISSSIIWPSLIPAAWRITLKSPTSPECRPVRQSPPRRSSVCLPLPRALIPLTPRGGPLGTSLRRMEGWSDALWLSLPSLQVKVATPIKKYSLYSVAYLFWTRLFRGIKPRSQEGNGDPCPPKSPSPPSPFPWAAQNFRQCCRKLETSSLTVQLTCSSGVKSDKCHWEVQGVLYLRPICWLYVLYSSFAAENSFPSVWNERRYTTWHPNTSKGQIQ